MSSAMTAGTPTMEAATGSPAHGGAPAATVHAPQDDDTGTLAMWAFLASEVLFFGALVFAYWIARSHAPDGFGLASRRTDPALGTLNTAILLVSSALVARAVERTTQDPEADCRGLLRTVAALGAAFLAIKGFEYHADWTQRLVPGDAFSLADVPGAALFFTLYFVMTLLHAVHVAVGIATWLWLARPRRRDGPLPDPHHLRIAGLYWHFVDVVWILFYPLLYLVSRQP